MDNIDVNELLIFENVIDFNFKTSKGPMQIITDDINKYNNNHHKSYYYIIDSPNSPALGHWIYESFIFIKLLIDLNKNNNNIKIFTKNNKKYVKNLLKFFNIHNDIVYNIDNYYNITYSPKIYSLHYNNIDAFNDTYFNFHLNFYINFIKNNLINLSSSNNIILLPRNNIDNFIPNDRKINNIDIIKDIIINNGGIVLDTYHLNNIKYQFSLINDAKIIILDFGSSVFLNCVFLENKHIYILDDTNLHISHLDKNLFPYKFHIINTYVLMKNKVQFINTNDLQLINDITKNI